MDVLGNGSFFISLQKSRFKQKLPEIVASFINVADMLKTLLDVEEFAIVQKLDEDQFNMNRKLYIPTAI
jgi:hypothetical protein